MEGHAALHDPRYRQYSPHGPSKSVVSIGGIRRSQTWAGPASLRGGENYFTSGEIEDEEEEGGPDVTPLPDAAALTSSLTQGRTTCTDFDAELLTEILQRDATGGKPIAIGRAADFLVRSTHSREVVWRTAKCIDIREDKNLACFEVSPSISGGTPVHHWISISEYPFRVSYPPGLRSGKKGEVPENAVFFATNHSEGDAEEHGGGGGVGAALGGAHLTLPRAKRIFATPRAMQLGAPNDAIIDTLGPLEVPRLHVFYKPSDKNYQLKHIVPVSASSSSTEDLSLFDHGDFIRNLRPGHVIGVLDMRIGDWNDAIVTKIITDSPALRWLNVEAFIGRGGSPSIPIIIAVAVAFISDGHGIIVPLSHDALRHTTCIGLPPPLGGDVDCIVAIREIDDVDPEETYNLDLRIERVAVNIIGVGQEPEGGVRVQALNSGINEESSVVESWRLRKSADKTPNAYYNVTDEPVDGFNFFRHLANLEWELEPVVISGMITRPGGVPTQGLFDSLAKRVFMCNCTASASVITQAISKLLLDQRAEFKKILLMWATACAEAERFITREAKMTSRLAREYWAAAEEVTCAVKANGKGSLDSPLRRHIPGTTPSQWPDIDEIAARVSQGGLLPISIVPTFLKILLIRRLLGCKLELFHSGSTLSSGTPSFSSSAPQIINEMALEEEDFNVATAASRRLICSGCHSHASPTLFAAIAQTSPIHWVLLSHKSPGVLEYKSMHGHSGDEIDLPKTPDTPPRLAAQGNESKYLDIVSRFAHSSRTPSLLFEIALDELRTTLALEIRASVVRAIAAKKKEEVNEALDDE